MKTYPAAVEDKTWSLIDILLDSDVGAIFNVFFCTFLIIFVNWLGYVAVKACLFTIITELINDSLESIYFIVIQLRPKTYPHRLNSETFFFQSPNLHYIDKVLRKSTKISVSRVAKVCAIVSYLEKILEADRTLFCWGITPLNSLW